MFWYVLGWNVFVIVEVFFIWGIYFGEIKDVILILDSLVFFNFLIKLIFFLVGIKFFLFWRLFCGLIFIIVIFLGNFINCFFFIL